MSEEVSNPLRELLKLQCQILQSTARGEPPSGIGQDAQQGPTPCGVTPHRLIVDQPGFRLLQYRGKRRAEFVEPVLICFALVNRPYVLDLQPDRSVIAKLLARGIDVYLVDWKLPSESDCGLQLQDYVCSFLAAAVEQTLRHSGASHLTLMGYCMGGTLSAMYAALNPTLVRNLILMAAPIDFERGEGLLNLWSQESIFDVDGLIDTYGNCPGWFLRSCFQLMKPVQNYIEKYQRLCENRENQAFLDNFLIMERWANDSVPVAGETFRQFVKLLYWQNLLFRGELVLGGRTVELGSIRCPLLAIVSECDHLVPAASTLALKERVNSTEFKALSTDAGHIGLAVSSKAHRQIWPQATEWIATNSTKRNTAGSEFSFADRTQS